LNRFLFRPEPLFSRYYRGNNPQCSFAPSGGAFFWKNLKKFVIKEGLFEVDVVNIFGEGIGLLMKKFWHGLLPKEDLCTAVDIGSTEIRVAEVAIEDEQPVVTALGSFPTPPEFLAGNFKSDTLVFALKQAVEYAGAKGRDCVAAITGQKVITRHVSVPVMPDRELEKAVRWEAEKFIPIPLDQSIVRHVNLGEVDSGDGKQLRLLLVAVPTELTYEYYDLFKLAGLHLAVIDVPCFALFRAYNRLVNESIGGETMAVVHFGAATSHFVLLKDDQLLYSRTMPVGGNHLTEVLARGLGMNFDEAEKLKLEYSGKVNLDEAAVTADPVQFRVGSSLQDGIGELAREIGRSLEFYHSQEFSLPVEKVIISGGPCKTEALVQFLEQEIDLPVSVGSLVLPLDECTGLSAIDNDYAVAAGLALRGVFSNV